ncbi:Inositol 2-dehydrogenase/D-chiro-inositol 3-dehydrogenase [Paenibacillus sp. CECT 9249]|uniref:Gfo/Idh/MocA family protein n=1 Tax=Paenibacillus sp. CECT 9249 TaxID=2845385 RepID=UPI001E5E0593|nr:Gfo/Idh/MocA family oxidoreductase [Paenibacillus sp. CECT 9249]CAH0122140.1 Inositol 2-dehydrogenase/D-chiro-inositol 3-dehydrogenase [Paenibacillus sp. CECT 9249]
MKKKVAIIGAGQIAEKVHVAYYQTREELEVAAVVDPNPERVQSFAERNGIPHYYTDAETMYASIKPDIVSVCTPNRFHCEHVMLAIANGCDVMCEKPPAVSAAEAKRMRDAAETNGSLLAYDFHHRFADDVAIFREKVKEGVLGDVYVTKVKALRRCGIPGWGSFTNKEIQGGGPLIDLGAHMLDAALYVLGFPKIERVTAKMYQKIGTKKSKGTLGEWNPEKYEVEDSLFGFIELEGGGLIQLETSFALNIKDTSVMNVEFCGDEAGGILFPAQIYTDEGGELVYIMDKETADPERHHKSMKAFVDRCLGEEVMVADGNQGYVVQQLIEALYQSAEKGESVTL